MNDPFSAAWDGEILQGRQETDTVLTAVGRRFRAEQFRAGGEDVVQANRGVVRAPRFDPRGPACKERHAVAAFPELRFVAPVLGAWEVTMLVEFFGVGILRGAAVVGAENEERVLALPVFFEGCEDLSDRVVVLHHEIGIGIDATFPLPFLTGNDGRMG